MNIVMTSLESNTKLHEQSCFELLTMRARTRPFVRSLKLQLESFRLRNKLARACLVIPRTRHITTRCRDSVWVHSVIA